MSDDFTGSRRRRVLVACAGPAPGRGAQLARVLRDAGDEVIWTGWPTSAAALGRVALQEDADVVVIDASESDVPAATAEAWAADLRGDGRPGVVVVGTNEPMVGLARRIDGAAAATASRQTSPTTAAAGPDGRPARGRQPGMEAEAQ